MSHVPHAKGARVKYVSVIELLRRRRQNWLHADRWIARAEEDTELMEPEVTWCIKRLG